MSFQHPHDVPQPYPLILRTRSYAWWRPLVGLLLVVLTMFVLGPVLVMPLLAVSVAVDHEGNVVDGTAGHWEGDYVNSGQVIGTFAGYAHDWDPGAGTQILQPLSNESGGAPTLLNWADPTGASSNASSTAR